MTIRTKFGFSVANYNTLNLPVSNRRNSCGANWDKEIFPAALIFRRQEIEHFLPVKLEIERSMTQLIN